jgi:stage III sporulation protein SpoIIIAA
VSLLAESCRQPWSRCVPIVAILSGAKIRELMERGTFREAEETRSVREAAERTRRRGHDEIRHVRDYNYRAVNTRQLACRSREDVVVPSQESQGGKRAGAGITSAV